MRLCPWIIATVWFVDLPLSQSVRVRLCLSVFVSVCQPLFMLACVCLFLFALVCGGACVCACLLDYALEPVSTSLPNKSLKVGPAARLFEVGGSKPQHAARPAHSLMCVWTRAVGRSTGPIGHRIAAGPEAA